MVYEPRIRRTMLGANLSLSMLGAVKQNLLIRSISFLFSARYSCMSFFCRPFVWLLDCKGGLQTLYRAYRLSHQSKSAAARLRV
jgi:hypothetical protein